jgi:hypothetical protein
MQIFLTHTEIQSQKLIEPYIGKWMRIAGSVFDVSLAPQLGQPARGVNVAMNTGDLKDLRHAFVYAEFDEQWVDRTSALSDGDEIVVTGRLIEVGVPGLTLDKAEFEFVQHGQR